MRNHNNDPIKTSDTVLRKIYLSLYLKGLCVRGSWRPNRTATYWPPHSIGHQRCVFLVLQGCSTGGPGAQLSAGCWLSLPHLVTNWSGPQTNWLPVFRELYNNSIAHSISPHSWTSESALVRIWIGMFDRHQAEITVMQFTGHLLPVHQSVTVPWDFSPVPSSPMPME